MQHLPDLRSLHEVCVRVEKVYVRRTDVGHSGIGVHYEPSALTNTKYQSLASQLIIGQRVIPQVLVRAADGRPFNIQDLLPSDARWKVLVFTGDTGDAEQLKKVNDSAAGLEEVLSKYSKDIQTVFEVVSIR